MTTSEQAVDNTEERVGEKETNASLTTSDVAGIATQNASSDDGSQPAPSAVRQMPSSDGQSPISGNDHQELAGDDSSTLPGDEHPTSSEEEEEHGGSSRLSNIIAGVFVVALIAFNAYAFWGYNDYGRPEVAPDNPVLAQVDGGAPEGSGAGVTAVPGVSAASDDLGASGLSEVASGPHPPASAPQATAKGGAPHAEASAPGPNGAVASAQAPGLPANGTAVAPTPSQVSSQQGAGSSAKVPVPPADGKGVAPAPGQALPKQSLATPPTFKAIVPPSPGKRPAPVFSKHNAPGSVDVVSMPGPQFLIGISALCDEPSVGLSDAQRTKIGTIVTKLIADQQGLTEAGAQSLSYLTKEQIDWMLNNRGNADVSGVEPEAGYDPFTTAYMRMLRGKKHDDGQALKQSTYTNIELSFQDIVNGLLRLEKEQPKLAVSTAQAKALLPVLIMANKARQSETVHYQQLHDVLTKQQRDWLYNHPEKTMMNVNDVVLNYVKLVVK